MFAVHCGTGVTFNGAAAKAYRSSEWAERGFCGDCGTQSNCLSIEPLETEYGRKRQINQASCNKDMSCIKGFCPSFVTIKGGRLRQRPRPARKKRSSSALPAWAWAAALL